VGVCEELTEGGGAGVAGDFDNVGVGFGYSEGVYTASGEIKSHGPDIVVVAWSGVSSFSDPDVEENRLVSVAVPAKVFGE
jgi:hypothetical protein